MWIRCTLHSQHVESLEAYSLVVVFVCAPFGLIAYLQAKYFGQLFSLFFYPYFP